MTYIPQPVSDAKYVDVAGDTMTGTLNVATATSGGVNVDSDSHAISRLDKGYEAAFAQFEFMTAGTQDFAVGTVGTGATRRLHFYAAGADLDALNVDRATGLVTVAADPTAALGVATKRYVDTRLAGRNRLINGSFAVNQRLFGSVTTNDTYGFDRWLLQCADGTVTYGGFVETVGVLPEPGQVYARVTTSGHSAATARATLSQRVESVTNFSGIIATVSFWARASSGTPKVAVEMYQQFGDGMGGEVSTVLGTVTLSTTWTRYSVTAAIPSIVGKTLGNNHNVGVNLWTSAGSNFAARAGSIGPQNATIDFYGVQAETGSIATPFEWRPYSEELLRCQRYYQAIRPTMAYQRYGSGNALNATQAEIMVQHYVPMRIAPSLGFGSPMALSNAVILAPITNVVTGQMSPFVSTFTVTVASGLTAGGSYQLCSNNSLSSVLNFNAEL